LDDLGKVAVRKRPKLERGLGSNLPNNPLPCYSQDARVGIQIDAVLIAKGDRDYRI